MSLRTIVSVSVAAVFFLSALPVLADQFLFSSGAPKGAKQVEVAAAVLGEALKRNGHTLEVVHLPSEAALQASNSGKTTYGKVVHGELHRIKEFHEQTNHKYPNLVRLDFVVAKVHLVGVSAKPGLKNVERGELKKYSVGYKRGRKNAERLLKEAGVTNTHVFSDDRLAIKMTINGNVDIAIVAISEILPSELQNATQVLDFDQIDTYPYINKQFETLKPVLEKTVQGMVADGTYKALLIQ